MRCQRDIQNWREKRLERRLSWPSNTTPRHKTKRASHTNEMLSSHFRFSNLGISGVSLGEMFGSQSSILEKTRLSDEKKNSVLDVLSQYGAAFEIEFQSQLSERLETILEDELCPFCLTSDSDDVGYAVLRCKLLHCYHVIHSNCALRYVPNDCSLMVHGTNTFRVCPDDQQKFSLVEHGYARAQCHLNVKIIHMISDKVLWSYDSPDTLQCFKDQGSNFEYLQVSPFAANIEAFRGRMVFSCSQNDGTTSRIEEVVLDCRLCPDMEQRDSINLVSMDSRMNTLLLGCRASVGAGLSLCNLKYTFSGLVMRTARQPCGKKCVGEVKESIRSLYTRSSALWEYHTPSSVNEWETTQIGSESTTESKSGHELSGKVFAMAQTQSGSRFIQEKLDSDDLEYLDLFFVELKDHAYELMLDGFGHYALQRLVQLSSDAQRMELLKSILPEIKDIACHKQGSFSLQGLMEHMNPNHIEIFSNALRNHLVQIITHQSGHFVVTKFLKLFSFPTSRFIVKAIKKHCQVVATDHFGLRVMNALFEQAPEEELTALFKEISRIPMRIVENQYGNYVVQAVLERAPADVSNSMLTKMKGKFVRLSKQKFSSCAVEKCLSFGTPEWRGAIMKELGNSAGKLIKDKYGNYVLQTALAVAEDDQVNELVDDLIPYLGSLRDNVRKKWEGILSEKGAGRSLSA